MRLSPLLMMSVLCIGGLAPVSHATADATASVVVLGLRSVEGDDDVANALTTALRTAVHDIPEWEVLDRSVSMTQMTLAHGCDDVDAACLNDIAAGLNVELVVFGTLRRTSSRSEFDYQLALSLFNANTASISDTENDVLPRAETEQPEALTVRARALVHRLAGGPAAGGGILSIQVNAPRADVRIDGQMVGQTQAGQLIIDGVPPGEHEIEISAIGRGAYTQRVTVSGTGQTNVIASLTPLANTDVEPAPNTDESSTGAADYGSGKPRKSLRWLGYTLIGVSGASLVGALASWLVINNINGDATFKKYRDVASPSTKDICAAAESGNMQGNGVTTGVTKKELEQVKDLCGTGETFEVLQWVFLGTAAVSGGIGTYILVTDKGRSEHAAVERPTGIALSPRVSRHSLSLSATLQF